MLETWPDDFLAEFADDSEDVTLAVVTPGTRSTTNPTAGTNPTSATHSARGILGNYSQRQIDGTIVRTGDRIGIVWGASLTAGVEPKPGDTLTFTDGVVWRIVGAVTRDPASVAFLCPARR